MIERAIAAGVPFSWVAADSVYGVGALETVLRRAGKGYVLGVNANHRFRSFGKTPAVAGTAEEIAKGLEPSAWQRLSAGEGTKGPRLYDWAYRELADLDAVEYDAAKTGLWTRGLLIRRTIADGALASFSTWCPAGTSIAKLVEVEGHRWAERAGGPRPRSGMGRQAEGVEDSFEAAKNEFGLDHNESRSWHGWHRHVSLSMLAFAMMAAIRYEPNLDAHPKKLPKTIRRRQT